MELYYIFNPLHPDISMHILHTVIYTFPIEKMRRIFSTNQVPHWLVSFSSCDLNGEFEVIL